MFGPRFFNAVICVSLMAAPAAAQSLGDVARREEARRAAATKKALKVLSNADLAPGAVAQSGVDEPSCYMSKSKGTCVSAEELVASSAAGAPTKQNAPLEQTYRAEAESIRSQIENTRNAISTLEAVLADPKRLASDKKEAETGLVAGRRTLAGLERNWERLERSVANQSLPHTWIEPVPTRTTVKE